MVAVATGPRKTRRTLRMYPLRLLLDILPELLVERRPLSRSRRVVASLPLAHRFARRSGRRTARQCRGSVSPLSLPHDPEWRQGLPQGLEPGESDCRNQEHDDRAANLTPRGAHRRRQFCFRCFMLHGALRGGQWPRPPNSWRFYVAGLEPWRIR